MPAERTAPVVLDDPHRLCHALRTPLHGLLGTLELLAETDLPPDVAELVRAARASAVELHAVLRRELAVCADDALSAQTSMR
jgi:signal transduction histidine kinase